MSQSLPSPAPSSLPSMSAATTNLHFYSPHVGSRPGIHWCSFPCKSLACVRDSSGQGGMGNLAVQPGLPLSLGPQLERRTALPPKGLRSDPARRPAAPPPAHSPLSCRSSRDIWWHQTGPDERKHEVRSSIASRALPRGGRCFPPGCRGHRVWDTGWGAGCVCLSDGQLKRR